MQQPDVRKTSRIYNLSTKSFTRWFRVEAAQADCKSLEGGERVAVIHGEDVFSNFPKL